MYAGANDLLLAVLLLSSKNIRVICCKKGIGKVSDHCENDL